MKKSILEIYALAVCFVTMVGLAVALGIAAYSVLEIARPDFTLSSYSYTQHQNNDAFWESCGHRGACAAEGDKKVRPAEAELTKRREASFAEILSNEQRDGAQSLVKCLIVMLVVALAFWFHWVTARHARAAPA